MNIMPKVLEELGVVIDEEFHVVVTKKGEAIPLCSLPPDIYHFNSDYELVTRIGMYSQELILARLLRGIYTIKKIPFKPQRGEVMFFVLIDGFISSDRFDEDLSCHLLLYNMGNCFRTKEEAEKNVDKMVKKFNDIQKTIRNE